MAGVGLLVGVFGLVFYLFMLLLPVALLIALQVWLCRKNVKLGIILPGLSLALSLLLTFTLVIFGTISTITVDGGNIRVTDENGNIVQEEVIAPKQERKVEFHPRTLIAAGVVFLVSNIPTVVFGGIWLHCKGRRDTYEDLKRMRIKDLE